MESDMFSNPLEGISLEGISFGGASKDDIPLQGEEVEEKEEFEFGQINPSIHLPKEDDFESEEEEEEETEDNFWKAVAEEGIIELGEDEDLKEANLSWFSEKAKTKLQKDLNEAIEEYKSSMPEEIKYLLENYEEGVPLHELISSEKKIFEIASIKEEDIESSESTQKRLISEMLKAQGESDIDIKEMLIDYEDSGLLPKMAKKAHSKLIQLEAKEKERIIESNKQQEIVKREKYKEWLTELKTTIDSKKEIFPGVELTEKQKKELFEGITKMDSKGKNAIAYFREKNPDFDLQVAYLATVLKGDLSILESVAATKASRKVKETADSSASNASKRRGGLKDLDINIMKNALKLK